MCVNLYIYIHVLPRNPPGDRWHRDSLYLHGTLLRNMPVPAHPQPPSPPTPPLPNAWHGHRNLSYACKHQNAAWLQFLGLNIYA